MKKIKYILIVGIFVLSMFFSSVNVLADPTVDKIETDPEAPPLLSTFKVLATITGEDIQSVNVTVSECTDGPPEQCFIGHVDQAMTLNDDGKWEVELTLKDDLDRTDHLQYQFVINDGGTEYTLSEKTWKTYLDVGSDDSDDDDGSSDSDGENGSPGFELILVLIAIIVGVIILKKKR